MHIVIIGDGKVGYALADRLSKEDNDIVIIDRNREALEKASETLDVMCLHGNGLSAHILEEAGARNTDLLIAATSSDEMNMVCCLTGKKLGARHTVARIRDPEYANELGMLKRELGLDMVINPEQAAAQEIARYLRFSSAISVETFARGSIELVEFRVTENDLLSGIKLSKLTPKINLRILFPIVQRGEDLIVPDGEFEMRPGDTAFVIGDPPTMNVFFKAIGKPMLKVKSVMIVGGSRIAFYLVRILTKIGIKIKIIELDPARCKELVAGLPKVLVIQGDGSDAQILTAEHVDEADAFISLTDRDEENLLSANFAKEMGVPKVIPKITRDQYAPLMRKLDIETFISPKTLTANSIIRFVRALKNSGATPAETLYQIAGGRAEALEFVVSRATHNLGKPLSALSLRPDMKIATIARKGVAHVPGGNDVLMEGDSVIIISLKHRLESLNDIFVRADS